jgi:phytoene dehydrogenase-like protein
MNAHPSKLYWSYPLFLVHLCRYVPSIIMHKLYCCRATINKLHINYLLIINRHRKFCRRITPKQETETSFVNTTCPSVSNPSLAAAAKNNAWVMLPYCPGKNFAHYLKKRKELSPLSKKKERTLPLSAHEQKTRFVFLY